MIVGFATIQILAPTSFVHAADLRLKSAEAHHRFARVVADYDATPIYLSRGRHGRDGFSDAYPVLDIYYPIMGPIPTRYLNGQPLTVFSRRKVFE